MTPHALLLHILRPPPPLLQSANCTSLPLLARHEGTGMQTALIMTFTVYAPVWSGKTLRSSVEAHTELVRPRWGFTTAACPCRSNTQVGVGGAYQTYPTVWSLQTTRLILRICLWHYFKLQKKLYFHFKCVHKRNVKHTNVWKLM